MNKKLVIGAVAVFLFGAIIVISYFAVNRNQPRPEPLAETQPLIGAMLPTYSMLDTDGVRERSEQWLGKVQLINFWATWCPPCKREIPALIKLQDDYRDHGLQIIGIVLDNAEAVKQYVRENNINYPTLVGEDDAVEISIQLGNDMGILPYTVIVDQTGNISYIHYGEVNRETVENEIKSLL